LGEVRGLGRTGNADANGVGAEGGWFRDSEWIDGEEDPQVPVDRRGLTTKQRLWGVRSMRESTCQLGEGRSKAVEIVVWAYWLVLSHRGDRFLSSVNLAYLRFAASRYEKVYLLAPCREVATRPEIGIIDLPNIVFLDLPYRSGGHLKYSIDVLVSLQRLWQLPRDIPVYLRVPDPLRWLPFVMGFRRITYHFVGNPLEVLSLGNDAQLPRFLMRLLYGGEERMIAYAIRHRSESRVFFNGETLREHLALRGLGGTVVSSSTLQEAEKRELRARTGTKLIHVGYLRRSKNLDVLVDMMVALRRRDVFASLDIVGDGDHREALQEKFAAAGLSPAIKFWGHVDDRERLAVLLQDANLFVFPSLSEGSPRVVVEAMAFGTVVVSSRVGSLPTVFSDGREIVFVSHATGEGFADAVASVLGDPARLERIRQAGYAKVWEELTMQKFLARVFP